MFFIFSQKTCIFHQSVQQHQATMLRSRRFERSTGVVITTPRAGGPTNLQALELAHFLAAINSFALLYKGVPFLTSAKPLIFNSFRAAITATIHGCFSPAACCFLLTTLPRLFTPM